MFFIDNKLRGEQMMNDKIAVYRIDAGLGISVSKDGEVDTLYFSGFTKPDDFYINVVRRKLEEIRRNFDYEKLEEIVINEVPEVEDAKSDKIKPLLDSEYKKILKNLK